MKFPNNGFVDANGQLTKAGQDALLKFTRDYADPIRFLKSITPKFARLIEEHIRLGFYDMEDFNAEVFMQSADAIRRYDPEKASVNTFLCWQIRKVARIYAVKFKFRPVRVGVVIDDDELSLLDTVTAIRKQNHVEEYDSLEEVNDILRVLPKMHQYVLYQNVVHGVTLSKIGEQFGLSHQRVMQIRNSAMRKVLGDSLREPARDRSALSRRAMERRRKKKCRHCGDKCSRPRQLCFSCYKEPSIRNQYPIDPQVAKWRERKVPVAIDAN